MLWRCQGEAVGIPFAPVQRYILRMPDDSPRNPAASALEMLQPASQADWDAYFHLRWRVLRAPWGQPHGSERDQLDSSGFHLLLKAQDGIVVAIGRLHLNSPDEAQVRYMAVDEAWRGRGLGARVLGGLEAEAKAKGAARVVLNAREEAIPFYSGHGYRVEGPADTLFGEVRHVRMRKELGK
jgi:GNAT superfamily N-acetyltransferase